MVGTATVSSVQTFRTPLSWSASYDARDRLIGFDRAGAQSAFAYDANGNRTSGTEQRTADTDLDGLYDADDFVRTTVTQLSIEASSNRLLGLTLVTTTQPQGQAGPTRTVGANIAYYLDANGSLTYDGQRELQYDSTGRLSAVRITRDQDSASVRYLHNALGQRVFKSEPKSDGAPADPAVVGDDFAAWLKKNFRWLFDQAAANASLARHSSSEMRNSRPGPSSASTTMEPRRVADVPSTSGCRLTMAPLFQSGSCGAANCMQCTLTTWARQGW
ncbi:MAG: hypothetical protein EOO27_44590 [Comamonadaceae bacterium]|nr:MAG: hypothetical protein EOO27_44590 [Comamonadaceae bacterium]